MTTILGIDPGKNGAMALLRVNNGKTTLHIERMPTVRKPGKTSAKLLNLWELNNILSNWHECHDERINMAYVELVGPRPHDGVHNAFEFGGAYHAAQALVVANIIPGPRLVAPQVWKRHFRIPPGSNKDASRAKASECFPEYCHNWRHKGDDGVAEAVLIASYGLWDHASRTAGMGDAESTELTIGGVQ